VFLTVANYFGVRAITEGNMGVVSMIGAFSLIVPCAYGLIFLGEKLSVFGIIGLILVFVSISLLSYKKQSGGLSAKCLIFSFITLFANGACSVLQKMQQTAQPNAFRAEFTLFSAVVAFLVFMLMKNTGSKKNQTVKDDVGKATFNKTTALYGSLSGLFNGASGLLVLTLAASQNASVLFPLLSVANSLVAVAVGKIVFKEKLTALQMLSVAIGIVSVVLLKI
jgi:drug/metabolite transporter (DMT)-like permease